MHVTRVLPCMSQVCCHARHTCVALYVTGVLPCTSHVCCHVCYRCVAMYVTGVLPCTSHVLPLRHMCVAHVCLIHVHCIVLQTCVWRHMYTACVSECATNSIGLILLTLYQVACLFMNNLLAGQNGKASSLL